MEKIDHGAAAAAIHGIGRSPHWPMAEKHCLANNPVCAASGIKTGLQVHHIFPFHFCILVGRPDLELDMQRNGIVLSESEKSLTEVNYHLLLGHAGFFQSSNLFVREDVKTFFGQTERQIAANPLFASRVENRCKPWDQWTAQQKTDFRAKLDQQCPLPVGITPEQQVETLVTAMKVKNK